jgi:hypothetical protein
MVVDWQFNADALVNIAKGTATSMLSALLNGMITPLTHELAKLGTSLTDSILGITQTKDIAGKITGGASNGGGLLGVLGGLFGGSGGALKNGTDEYGNIISVGGGVGGAGGISGALGSVGSFLGSTAGIATMGIGAAAAGIISWVKSQSHWEANDLVQNLQAPFDSAIAAIVDKITIGKEAGTLTQRDVLDAQQGEHELWNSINQAVETWRTAKGNSADRDKVASQFHQTEDAFMANQLAGIDALAHFHYWDTSYRDGSVNDAAASQLPHYAMGTPWVSRDGPAYLHRGEAVIPASANKSPGGVNVTVSPTYNFSLGSGAGNSRDFIEKIKWALKNNTQALAEAVARSVRDTGPGLATR